MWCPNCKSKTPLVALHHESLLCARCQTEVLSTPTTKIHDLGTPTSQSTSKRNLILPLTSSVALSSQGPIGSDTPLFRFDSAHKTRRATEPAIQPDQSTTVPKGDSPSLLALLTIFFVGQSLIVWAYFQQNVNGLGLGMILAVAAVGLGLRAISPKRGPVATGTTFFSPNKPSMTTTSTESTPSTPKMRVLPGTRTQPRSLRKTRRPPVRDT